jgi:hypothetical protein
MDEKKELEVMADAFQAGADWSVKGAVALHKAGLEPAGRAAFMGMLHLAFSSYRIQCRQQGLSTEQAAKDFAEMAGVVAKVYGEIADEARKDPARMKKAEEAAEKVMGKGEEEKLTWH